MNMAENSEEIRASRRVRDNVFSSLLGQKEYCLQVYKELYPNDTTITEEDLKYNTIENIFANGHMYNDLSFSVKGSIVLFIEAQSTWTENTLIRNRFQNDF